MHRLAVAMNRLRTHGPNPENPDAVQQRILKVVRSAGLQPTRALFRKLRHNIHAQRGVKERFRKGIIRSGRYLQQMEAIFESHGLPKMLVRLPHVESSFNYASRSSKGAAGIWQFMPRTGRAYKLRVGRSVDERLDPIAATDGAARYLKDAYRKLGNWPLAVTSYNHGQAGMARAKRRHGPNLPTIIDKYRSRSFRYASKNFYAEFLAAIEVSQNYRAYFGPLALLEPLQFQEIYLEKSVRVRTFTAIEGLSQNVLREYNPQFKRRLWTRSRVLPAGFKLRVPAGKAVEARVALAKAPAVRWRGAPAKVPPDGYRVRWGDSLTVIARRFGTSVKAIQRLNDLDGTRIYTGQVLRIPGLRRASAGQGDPSPSQSAGGASTNSTASAPERYRVRRGDSLSLIAQRFGTSVGAIKRMNGLRGSRIHPGQVLKLSEPPQVPKDSAGPGTTASAKTKAQPSTPQPPASQPRVYRVRRGDSLITIARRFGTSVGEIRRANRLKGSRILAGQRLKIPVRATATAKRQPSGAESTSGTAKPAASIPAIVRYRVRRGDSLDAIAKKFGVSVRQLRAANAIRGHLIHPGQTLTVPANGTDPTADKQ
jgi:membrane-bound lytic murein transglycosylase D